MICYLRAFQRQGNSCVEQRRQINLEEMEIWVCIYWELNPGPCVLYPRPYCWATASPNPTTEARNWNPCKVENMKAFEHLRTDYWCQLWFSNLQRLDQTISVWTCQVDSICCSSLRATGLSSALTYFLLLMPESIRDPLLKAKQHIQPPRTSAGGRARSL